MTGAPLPAETGAESSLPAFSASQSSWNGDGVGYSFVYAQPYDGAAFDKQETKNWSPNYSSGDLNVLRAKDMTLARVRDLVRNNPIAGAAVERLVDMIVGSGLRLISTPDAPALGITPEQAHDLAQSIQAEWRHFAEDPRRLADAQRKLTVNGLFRLFARTWLTAGEATYTLTWRDAPGARYSTCVLAVDPDRVSNPRQTINTLTLRGGVEMDTFGAPVAYHVRNAHAGDYWAYGAAWSWTRVPRATAWGRPVFVHGFEPEREGQTRGITPFASLIGRLKMIDRFADAELASAVANALFAAFVETDLPVDEVAARLAPKAEVTGGRRGYMNEVIDHFSKHPAKLPGGARIPVLPPGSKVTVNDSPRQTTAFPAFERAFVNKFASRLGLSGEQLTMDWSQTNYSSARAALNEAWRSILRMAASFREQIVQPIFFAFLDEAFDKGYIPSPSRVAFVDMPGAFMRCRWIGPARGYIDPVKEAEAAALRMESLTSTLEKECAEQGADYEEVLDQIEREEIALKKRKLTRMSIVAAVQSSKGPKPDSEEATGPAGAGGKDKEGSA